jgi:competence protein ComEC
MLLKGYRFLFSVFILWLSVACAPPATPTPTDVTSVASANTVTPISFATPDVTSVSPAFTVTPTAFVTPAIELARDGRTISQGQLQVHFIDVGQGDSIFIRTTAGETALIDGGYNNGRALAYLQQMGVDHIDSMIASHPHADHIGGLVEVLRSLPVGGVWASGASHNTGIYEQFLDAIAEAKVPYHEVTTGDVVPLGDTVLQVLYGQPEAPDLNDTSLVLHLAYGEVSFLFTGDAEAYTERFLLETAPQNLPATILKVGHHGSYTSSSPEFLAAVQPDIAVYSAGRGNQYGHPHDRTIQVLSHAGVQIFGTKEQGTITITTDGQQYQVFTQAGEAITVGAGEESVLVDAVTPTPVIADGTSLTLTLRFDPNGRDRDCGSFETQAEAQAFFIAAGGPERDPHRLDGNSNGIVCEHLP